eukprot:160329_1
MNNAKSPEASNNDIDSSDVVYIGIPLTQADAEGDSPPSYSPKPRNCKMPGGYGLLAFVVGAILGVTCWILHQGWAIVSFLIFDPQVKRTLAFVCILIFGSILITHAFWVVLMKICHGIVDYDKDNEKVKESLSSMNNSLKDILEAVQDLGEAGLIVGYFGSHFFLESFMYKPLIKLGIRPDYRPNRCLERATLIFAMMWVLYIYKRAVNRAAIKIVHVSTVGSSSARPLGLKGAWARPEISYAS